ncbi:DUF2381 family protein [Corallococcus sp. bb12-1]|uniref:DUF2381 family protein n=1 Tax=Corallococcus sp. bb12-1 TaxID=2996784 RepID=UPI00226DAD76|nr:DUF2381 family protein [Corallococcus sp. bb12-1]MCY1046488.1 DUF2381 family protein [Corallococcus sp. bb12-1]
MNLCLLAARSHEAVAFTWKVALVAALTLAAGAAAQVRDASDEEGVGRIDVSAEREGTPHELTVSPGLATLLLSDSPVARWELTGRENFRRVMEGTDTLALLPRSDVKEGTRLKLTLVFADGAAPVRAELVLVVHPALAQRQVELYRHPRSMESYQQEVRQLRAEVGRTQAEVERLRATQARPDGLTGLLASGVMVDEGVAFRDLTLTFQRTQKEALSMRRVTTFRAATRAAIRATLQNHLEVSWRPMGAALVDGTGRTVSPLGIWPQEPIASGAKGLVIVEFELPSSKALGPYTLKLWAEDGTHTVTVRNISFP